MNIASLSQKLKEINLLDEKVTKYTLLVNEKSEVQGALFFVPISGKDFKVIVPAPFHQDLVSDADSLTYKKLLSHKEAAVLK